jgi:hypothetical protein
MVEFSPSPAANVLPVSIKLRVDSGCFCRSCCPEGHRLIADYLRQHRDVEVEARIIEHESGPEILTYINLAAGVCALAASVISLVVAIVQARAEGAKRGDKRGHPFRLSIRRIGDEQKFEEDIVMEIPLDKDSAIDSIADRLLKHVNQIKAATPKKKAAKRKKKC